MAMKTGRAMLANKNGAALSGEMSVTVTEDGATMRYKTKSMDGQGSEYDGKDCTIELSGIVDDSDTGAKAIQTAKQTETKITDLTVVCGWGTYSGTFTVASCSLTGAEGGMQEFSATLESDNGYSFS